MSTFYFILTAILSSIATYITPTLVLRYRRYKRAKKQQLNELIALEVERQLKQIVND
jgi:hypothetical protein